ncbi:MAG: cytochrome c [Sandarakinorhabdus sp.]|nr:cytochrome c [Sandarakinorhabdus sp.]
MRFAILSLGLLAGPSLAAAPSAVDSGAIVYEEVCKACHMADAKGAVGAGRIASLAANPNLAYPEYPIAVVTGGRGAMPWFRGQLTDQQIADAISYVRMHFGNKYKARVTAAQVAELGVKAPKGGRE